MRSEPLAVAVTVELAERLGVAGADRAAALVAAVGGERVTWRISAAPPARLDVMVTLDDDDDGAHGPGDAMTRALVHAGQPFLGRTLERAAGLAGGDALGLSLGGDEPRWIWGRGVRAGADDRVHAAWLAGFEAALPELTGDALALSALAPGGLRGVIVDGAGETTAGSELWWAIADDRALLRVLEHAAIPADDDGRVFCRGVVGMGSARPWPLLAVGRRHGARAGWSFACAAAAVDPARLRDLALLDAVEACVATRDAWGLLARYAHYRDVIAAAAWHVDDAPPGARRRSRWSLTLSA